MDLSLRKFQTVMSSVLEKVRNMSLKNTLHTMYTELGILRFCVICMYVPILCRDFKKLERLQKCMQDFNFVNLLTNSLRSRLKCVLTLENYFKLSAPRLLK